MFFFPWVPLEPVPEMPSRAPKPLKAPKSPKSPRASKPPKAAQDLTPYTQDGRYARAQRVFHPDRGPGTVMLVRIKRVIILFDSQSQNPPLLEKCGIPVKGLQFLSARIDLMERNKANGATFDVIRTKACAARTARETRLRKKRKQAQQGMNRSWSKLVRPLSSFDTDRSRYWHVVSYWSETGLHCPSLPFAG